MWLAALLHAAWTPWPPRLPEPHLPQPEKTSRWGGGTSPWRGAASPSLHTECALAPRTVSNAISPNTLSRRDAAAAAFPLALAPLVVPRNAAAAATACDTKAVKRLAATAELLDLAVQASYKSNHQGLHHAHLRHHTRTPTLHPYSCTPTPAETVAPLHCMSCRRARCRHGARLQVLGLGFRVTVRARARARVRARVRVS